MGVGAAVDPVRTISGGGNRRVSLQFFQDGVALDGIGEFPEQGGHAKVGKTT